VYELDSFGLATGSGCGSSERISYFRVWWNVGGFLFSWNTVRLVPWSLARNLKTRGERTGPQQWYHFSDLRGLFWNLPDRL